MSLSEDAVIWITSRMGVVTEEYQGKWSLKAVKKYESQGQEKVSYDWAFGQEYDKDRREWRAKDKAVPVNIYLGDKGQAVKALLAILRSLGSHPGDPAPVDPENVPF